MKKMRSKFFVMMLTSIFCVASGFSGVSNAHSSHSTLSSSTSSSTEQFAEMITTYHDHTIELTENKLLQLKQTILQKWEQGEIETIEPKYNFDFDKIKGVAFDGELQNLKPYYVFIPFQESTGHYMPLSGITFAFSNDETIVQAHEVIIDRIGNSLVIKIYSNGTLVGSKVIHGVASQEIISTMGYWDDVAACLSQFGADGALIQSALATCSLVCSVTGPAGCAACIGIYLAIDAGIIVGCLIQ